MSLVFSGVQLICDTDSNYCEKSWSEYLHKLYIFYYIFKRLIFVWFIGWGWFLVDFARILSNYFFLLDRNLLYIIYHKYKSYHYVLHLKVLLNILSFRSQASIADTLYILLIFHVAIATYSSRWRKEVEHYGWEFTIYLVLFSGCEKFLASFAEMWDFPITPLFSEILR